MRVQLSSPSSWRIDFFNLLAELADELLPSEFNSELRSGNDADIEKLWASHAVLTPLPVGSQPLMEATDTIIERAQERSLLGGVSSEDLFQLLLGRPLDRQEPGAAGQPLTRTLSDILRSPEFSRSLPWIAKTVINRGQWNYFVHVPKTAGSHFQALLWTQFGPGSLLRISPNRESGIAHPWVVAGWLRHLLNDDDPAVWVSGHLKLHDIRPTHSVWPTDRIFTLVRDPIDQAISATNYHFGRREAEPEAAHRYFTHALGVEAPHDLGSLDLSRAVVGVAAKDLALRPSYFFDGDLPAAALRDHVIVGFQEDPLALLELAAHQSELRLPPDVMDNSVRLNQSHSNIDAATLEPEAITELVRASQDAVVDYFALRALAAGQPYVQQRPPDQ